MHIVEKWPNIILKSCEVRTARLKILRCELRKILKVRLVIFQCNALNERIKLISLLWAFLWFDVATIFWCLNENHAAQKMKFSIKDFFSKCDQICSFLRMWSHLLKKSLMENAIFCAVPEAYLGPYQTSMIDPFVKLVKMVF